MSEIPIPQSESCNTSDISSHPYLLQVDLQHAKHIPKADLTSSDPYAIIRYGSIEVARTRVIKWSLNPVWNESFTVPLLHLQHDLVIEIWDWNHYEDHEIIGKVTVNLNHIERNSLIEDNFCIEQAGVKAASGYLSCGIYLEKRRHMIHVKHLPSNQSQHILLYDQKQFTNLNKMVRQDYNHLNILPSVQEAIEKSDILRQKDFDYALFRDLLYDMQSLTREEGDQGTDDVSDTNVRAVLPMTMHRVDDSNNDGVPVTSSKSTRINLSTDSVEMFICPFSKHGRHSFSVETETDSLTFVAPHQYLVWVWIRAIRRSFSSFSVRMKESDMSDTITSGDLYRKNHVAGLNSTISDEQYFNGTMKVVIEDELRDCTCRLDMVQMLLTYVEDDCDSQATPTSFSLVNLTSITVALDYAECVDMSLRFDLMSAKLVLSRANHQSSYNEKSTLQQLKHGMTVISSQASHIVVNFLDGRDLISNPIDGISPFWNLSTTVGIGSNSFGKADVNTSLKGMCNPAAFHIHMLTGPKGQETVLGSKIVSYADIYAQDFALSVESGDAKETDLKSHFVKLDMNFGLKLDIISGEGLVSSKKSASSFLNLFGEKDSPLSRDDVYNPYVEVRCMRHGEDPLKRSGFKKQSTQHRSLTADPEWNETIIINTSDGLHSAHYVQLRVKDYDTGRTKGVVYIPMSEFFSHEMIEGESILKRYPVMSLECTPFTMVRLDDDSHSGKNSLGYLCLRLHLVQEGRNCPTSELHGVKVSSSNMNVVPIEVEFKTQLKATNAYSSYFVCDCVTTTSLPHIESANDNRIERFTMAVGSESLVLRSFIDFKENTTSDTALTESALLHQFQRYTKRKKIACQDIDESECEAGSSLDQQWEDIVVYYFYENQRSVGIRNFSGSNLSSLDRGQFTDETGCYNSPFSPDEFVKFKPPTGYMWDVKHANKWTIDYDYTETDKKGWSYGIDFNHLMQRLRKGTSTTNKLLQNVRRRRWQRIAVLSSSDVPKTLVDPTVENGRRFKFGTLSRSFANSQLDDSIAVYTVFYNQRRGINLSWSDKNLLSLERPKYSNENATKMYYVENIDELPPPVGYKWAEGSEWVVDKDYLETDANGWVYGIDFSSIERNYRSHTSNTSKGLFSCRRQKLNRHIVEDDGPSRLAILPDQSLQIRRQHFSFESVGTASDDFDRNIALSKEDAFENDKNSILKYCIEREKGCAGPICIPWPQVKSVDVISPAIVSVVVTVNRYLGQSRHAPVDVEIFVYECPAEKLCLLIRDRLQVSALRDDVRQLVTSGTLTGDSGSAYEYRSVTNNDFETTNLSLGSVISKNIFYEIEDIESAIHSKVIILKGGNASEVIKLWAKNHILHLKSLKERLKLYARFLLTSDLKGPEFDEQIVSRVVKSDRQLALYMVKKKKEQDECQIVESTKDAVAFLLEAAEARICDYALSGWTHQGAALDNIISVLVNGYFISMIEILGFFFESKDILTSLKGNGDKLALINFILEHDSSLSMVIESSLRPYNMQVKPEPLFSYSLNINTLLEWYTVHLRNEIMTYVNRSFSLNQSHGINQSTGQQYQLPWEVLDDHGLVQSNIPLDVVMLLKGYFDLLSKADKPNISFSMRAGLLFLNQKIREFQIDSFVTLIENYRSVLLCHDWTIPQSDSKSVNKYDKVSNEEDLFAAMGAHLSWLSSVGNDMIHLQRRVSEFNNVKFEYTADLIRAKENFLDLSHSTIKISIDFMSCIIFKSFEAILPCSNIYRKWVADRATKNLTERIVGELIWYLESNSTRLLPSCNLELLRCCLIKFSIWYFSFLNECVSSKISFTYDDFEHLAEDCEFIHGQFCQMLNYYEPSVTKVMAVNARRDIGPLVSRFSQIKKILTSPRESVEMNEVLAELLTECDSLKYKARAIAQMIRIVYQLRCFTECDDLDISSENEDWFGLKIEMLTSTIDNIQSFAAAEITDSFSPEVIVWDPIHHKTLVQSLVKSQFI